MKMVRAYTDGHCRKKKIREWETGLNTFTSEVEYKPSKTIGFHRNIYKKIMKLKPKELSPTFRLIGNNIKN